MDAFISFLRRTEDISQRIKRGTWPRLIIDTEDRKKKFSVSFYGFGYNILVHAFDSLLEMLDVQA